MKQYEAHNATYLQRPTSANLDQDQRSFVLAATYLVDASERRGPFDLSTLTVNAAHRYHAPGETRQAMASKDVFSHT